MFTYLPTMKIKILTFAAFVALLLPACQQNTPKTPPITATAASVDALPWASDLDLVCEMKVNQTVEDTVHYQGKIYGFCNGGCKDKFLENPTDYIAK